MRVLRLALASMMDFRFEPGKVPARLTEWWDRHQDEQLYDGYYESYFWLFEAAPRRPGNGLPSLEGTSRYAFKLDSEQHMGTASTLLVPAKGAGVVTLWTRAGASEPLKEKDRLWSTSREQLRMVPLPAYHGERHYPFMAIQVESQDLDRFCAENAEDLARLFTGDYEKESPGWLRSHLEKDLSHRSYERLYIRWTDALAVYSSGISEEDYRLSLLRSAQLFEHCILVRRLLRSDSFEISQLARQVIIVDAPVVTARWRHANAILASSSEIEYRYVIAPDVRSVEAERLLSAALTEFGIPALH